MLMEPVNAPARWWPCACLKCVSGLRRLENPWTFWDAFMSLTWCSNMVQTYMKETGYGFSFTWWYCWVQLLPLLEWVFFSCVSGFRLKISRFALLRKRLQLDSKSDLTTNGLIVGFFCWEMASFVDFISVWTKICTNCSIVILFWRHQIFSMFSLRGILVCSLKNACTFEP